MRIVVKVGTHLVTRENYRLDTDFLKVLTAQIASLVAEGHEMVLVSSGAVAAGRNEISFEKEKKNIPYRQVLAAVGQSKLMATYHDFFKEFKIPVAQALLTNYDFTNRENFLNTKSVFDELLKKRIIPVVNENDVTTIAELKFGDNDMLSAKTAAMISADLLVLLTTVDGLYTDDPEKNDKAEFISFVEKTDKNILDLASKETKPGTMGGMRSKVLAAQYAAESGAAVCIANGRRTNILRDIAGRYEALREDDRKIARFPGTFFKPRKISEHSFKKWMKPKILKKAEIIVDDGCREALLKRGKSLLPSGIRDVAGNFSRGDIVTLFDMSGSTLGYGQTNYSAPELLKIKGAKSEKIEERLGYAFEDEVIHRDKMVIL